MSGKIESFLKEFGGFIIGAVIGMLVAMIPFAVEFLMTTVVVLIFGWLGHYVQHNKMKVKEVLKNLIEKW